MKESKQPIVYVPRALYIRDYNDEDIIFGWFVSKAYLKRKVFDYKTNGVRSINYFVDFNINPAIYSSDSYTGIYAENGDNEEKTIVFKDYKSCKEFVNILNKDRNKTLPILLRGGWTLGGEAKFTEVLEYAERLESQLIPAEERKDKDGLLSALEDARGF